MNLSLKLCLSLGLLLAGCSEVLNEPRMPEVGDPELQENLDLKIEPLTSASIARLNAAVPQPRVVVVEEGLRVSAPVDFAKRERRLPSTSPIPYRVGLGDELTLTRFETVSGLTNDDARDAVISFSSRVGRDGQLLFMETGPIFAEGKTLEDIRAEVSGALIRNGIDPRFQLEISGFGSQKVFFLETLLPTGGELKVGEGNVGGTAAYTITDTPLSLRELLVTAKAKRQPMSVQYVEVLRRGVPYWMPVSHVFSAEAPDYYLVGGDVVNFREYRRDAGVAYAFGGSATPQEIQLSAEAPVTLSQVLFREGGALSVPSSAKWDVYLLRGRSPIVAHHLDATNPARITLASQVEIQRDDVVFVSEKPIYETNTLLGLLLPIRGLFGLGAN